MKDRELLELAAKAAGYELDWFPDGTCDLVTKRGVGDVIRSGWNPLADDGDALRLAVKLGGELRIHAEETWSAFGAIYSDEGMFEYHEVDPCAATRRAIVRAATAIGEQMQ